MSLVLGWEQLNAYLARMVFIRAAGANASARLASFGQRKRARQVALVDKAIAKITERIGE